MQPEAIKSEQKKIFEKLKHFPEFYLVGGTALALQIGHRISVDFDLFSEKEIPAGLLGKLKRVFGGFKINIITDRSEQLSVMVDKIKIDFVKYPFPIVLGLIKYRDIKLLSVPEIGAAKAFTIGRRPVLKDYIDLYFILEKGYATLEELAKLAEKKYKDEFNFRLFLEQLVYLEDVKDEKIEFLQEKVTKQQLQAFFENEIKKIKI